MRKILFLILIIPIYLTAQVIDDFSDGDFTNNPLWKGDDSLFKCSLLSSNHVLQLNATIPKTACLYTENNMFDNVEWRFYIKLNFNPSSTSYAKVYLMSDNSVLTASLNGYYLQFGETNNTDIIRLFKQSGTTSTIICSGTTSIASAFEINVKVTRDENGEWKIFSAPVSTQNYKYEASGIDTTFKTTSYFGILCKFSTSTYNKFFYFDDFYVGNIIVDTIPPEISNINVVSQNKIDVIYSEFVEKTSAEYVLNYSVNNAVGNPIAAVRDSTDSTIVHLTFSSAFNNGTKSILSAINIKDVNGNMANILTKDFIYCVPESFDIVINEVLFNPKDDGVDFVEIYNRSEKIIDLKDLNISSFDTVHNVLASINSIINESYLFLPGEYIVVTINPDIVKSQYKTINPNGFIKVSSMPSFNNDKGIIVISNNKSSIIDMFKYSESMHFPLLNNHEGVSLERVDYNRKTDDNTNWQSASENIGYATPGYKNSQYNDTKNSDNAISISPEIFSPDNDGVNDILNVLYKFDTPSYIANVSVYDSKGRFVKNILRNKRLDESGVVSWNGINENNEKCRIGIYIVYFEVFDLQGKVKHYKNTFVLAGKL